MINQNRGPLHRSFENTTHFDIKKNETPWSVDIYLNDVKRLKKNWKKKKYLLDMFIRPLIHKKFTNILKIYQYQIFIVKEVCGCHLV